MSTPNTQTERTVAVYKMLYGSLDDWYDTLEGERKSWVDNNWKSMLEHFLEYAEQSLAESVEQTEETIESFVCYDCCLFTNQSPEERKKYDPLCEQCWKKAESKEAGE